MGALRVLIIEDETLIALLFAEVLAELGHEVCASERTEAGAIAAAARCRPDLIIADVRLHEGSGISAVNAILNAGFVPHIFISGDVLNRKCLHPAAGVLQKPFLETQLVEAIERAVKPENILIGKSTGKHPEI
jgi:two-component system, response regulator PdtaR